MEITQPGLSAGQGGKTLTPETPTGTVNGSNLTFSVLNTPVLLFTDGLYRYITTDYTYSGGVITMNALIPPVNSIISFYNA